MNKIGLSVCYDTKNFGSQLQVLATIKKIEDLGYENEIIRYKKKFSLYFIMQQMPRLFNFYFIKGKLRGRKKEKAIKNNAEVYSNVLVRDKRFLEFQKKYFTNLSEEYIGWKNLVNGVKEEYSAFLCGSDQLWLPSNLESHFYTLEYAPENKIKISYAPSFGVSEIPWYQRNRTKRYLNRFQALSIRELKGAEIIKGLTGNEVNVVCDPTLLLTKKEWDETLPNKNIINEKYIFCYFLGENIEHRKEAEKLREKTDYKIVTIPFLDNFVEHDLKFGDYKMFDIDTEDFVNLIRNAEYVLTDSFHGTIFSILNHKKFITFNRFENGKDSRNSRIDSLCKLLGLESRRFNTNIKFQIHNDIDYEAVEEKLNEFREDSIKFLSTALNNIGNFN